MPDSLFYYCSLNSSERREWLERLLVKHEVYFRSRAQLNDPNELRPTVIFDGTDEQFRRYARDLIRRRWPVHLSPAKRLQEESKLIYNYKKQEWFERMLHEILDRLGLFCMSELVTENLLWAHYADGHRGICVEFNATAGVFPAAKMVTYTDQAPVINPLVDGRSEMINKSVLTKVSAWAYEREWRVIARWRDEERIRLYLTQHAVSPHVQAFIRDQHGPGYYSIPADAIRSVILGERTEPRICEWLESVINSSHGRMVLKRASIARDGTMAIG